MAHALSLNVRGFIQDYGLNYCALLTLVCGRHVRWRQAKENLARTQRTLLDPLFRAWICVVELHKDGRPHFHFVVAHEQDLRTGFDFAARNQAKEISRRGPAEGRRLTTAESSLYRHLGEQSYRDAPVLRGLWSQIRSRLPGYGFGRVHCGSLEPIIDPNGLAPYLAKSFGNGALPRPRELKNSRLIRYSRGQRRRANLKFAWNSARARLNRHQQAYIGNALGIEDGGFKGVYGPRWYHRLQELVEHLEHSTGSHGVEPCWPVDLIQRVAPRFMPRVAGFVDVQQSA